MSALKQPKSDIEKLLEASLQLNEQKKTMEANQAVFKAGYDTGYSKGFSDGIAECKKIVDATFGDKAVAK